MWVYAESRLVVLEEYLSAGRATEAVVEEQWRVARVTRETCGYSSDSPDRAGYNSEDINRLESGSWISTTYQPGGGNGPDDGQAGDNEQNGGHAGGDGRSGDGP